jgi:hypothetical protein
VETALKMIEFAGVDYVTFESAREHCAGGDIPHHLLLIDIYMLMQADLEMEMVLLQKR